LFEKQSGRKPREESTSRFMRKGIVRDWENHFSKQAAIIFNHYAGKELIRLGYEKDDNWVNR